MRSLIIFKLQPAKNDTQKAKCFNSNFDLCKKQIFNVFRDQIKTRFSVCITGYALFQWKSL
jgi:hypothetical protein